MSFDLSTSTSGVSFDSTSTFSTSPSVAFTQAPVANQVNDPETPTNTADSTIICPKVDVFLISGTSSSSSGISVSRDTSGDTSTVCGYAATLQHFSNYFSSVSTQSSSSDTGGGTKGDVTPPTFSGSVFSGSEYPLSIDGASFRLPNYSNSISTQIKEAGKPVELKLLAFEDSGKQIEYVAIYTNLRSDTREIHNSDTYIIYEKGKDLQIFDPNGLFSDVKVKTETKQDKEEFSFEITFAKSMEKSDIIVRMWDHKRNNLDVKIFDAWQIVGDDITKEEQFSLLLAEPAVKQAESSEFALFDEKVSLTLDKWAGYYSETASDHSMLKELGFEGSYIPQWVKKTFGKGIYEKNLEIEDLVTVIDYLIKIGIVK